MAPLKPRCPQPTPIMQNLKCSISTILENNRGLWTIYFSIVHVIIWFEGGVKLKAALFQSHQHDDKAWWESLKIHYTWADQDIYLYFDVLSKAFRVILILTCTHPSNILWSTWHRCFISWTSSAVLSAHWPFSIGFTKVLVNSFRVPRRLGLTKLTMQWSERKMDDYEQKIFLVFSQCEKMVLFFTRYNNDGFFYVNGSWGRPVVISNP